MAQLNSSSVYPCIWAKENIKEIAAFYKNVFPDVEILSENDLAIQCSIQSQKFLIMNGRTGIEINPSISFFAQFNTMEEVKKVWDYFIKEGSILMNLDKYPWSECYGWVADKFGINWQVMLWQKEDEGSKLSPSLMFVKANAGKAEAAINYYKSIFREFKSGGIARYEKGDTDVEGYIKHSQFYLDGCKLMAMDSSGDHPFQFNDGISLVKECDDQEEIDHYWNGFVAEGKAGRCGWLKDKFGVSWQIVPKNMGKIMSEAKDRKKIMEALMGMGKLEVEKLVEAGKGD